MIRFLDLTNQIDDDTVAFAFYDTVSDRILYFNEGQVFTSRQNFTDNYDIAVTLHPSYGWWPKQRLLNLIPDHIK